MNREISNCPFCNSSVKLITNYDSEYVECTKCKVKSHIEIGDYYDEGFMCGNYIINSWNKVVDYINSKFKNIRQ